MSALYKEGIVKHIERVKMNIILDRETVESIKNHPDYDKVKKFIKVIDRPKTDGNYPTRYNKSKGMFEHVGAQ